MIENLVEKAFEMTCMNRYFELEAAEAIRQKLIKTPTYLSVGQEHIPACVAAVKKDWLIFPQHRCHSYYLSFGGPPELLAKELLGRPDGCNGGKGGSASVSWKPINLFGHSGLLGDQIPIAVGAAEASGKAALAVLGDAAAEEDYVLASLGYAASRKAPVLFLCEDNDLSILTKKEVRRSWDIVKVAKAFGLAAYDVPDGPEGIINAVQSLLPKLPALLNVRTCRHLWHAGAGCDGPPRYNCFEMFKEKVSKAKEIEEKAKIFMRDTWLPLLKR